MTNLKKNIDFKTVKSFGDEWSRHNQEKISIKELKVFFNSYFSIFSWNKINKKSVGFDLGCGSGRWAKFISPKIGTLNCIDPSLLAINVAKKNLQNFKNIIFFNISVDLLVKKLKKNSQDFGYSLGVLHHVPDTHRALESCYNVLKPGAPFLIYLYYSFDNRGFVFKIIWKISDILRKSICILPNLLKNLITDLIALIIYFPISKLSFLLEKLSFDTSNIILSYYKNSSFATMRTDSRDRFGTPLEKRFSKEEIYKMMQQTGFKKIKFRNKAPYWCAIGYKNSKSYE